MASSQKAGMSASALADNPPPRPRHTASDIIRYMDPFAAFLALFLSQTINTVFKSRIDGVIGSQSTLRLTAEVIVILIIRYYVWYYKMTRLVHTMLFAATAAFAYASLECQELKFNSEFLKSFAKAYIQFFTILSCLNYVSTTTNVPLPKNKTNDAADTNTNKAIKAPVRGLDLPRLPEKKKKKKIGKGKTVAPASFFNRDDDDEMPAQAAPPTTMLMTLGTLHPEEQEKMKREQAERDAAAAAAAAAKEQRGDKPKQMMSSPAAALWGASLF